MTLGDRVAVMRAGRIEQLAPPLELYRRPATSFVAGFVGSPAMNLLPCTIDDGQVRTGALSLPIATFSFAIDAPPRDAVLGIRPPDLEIVAVDQGDANGRLEVIEALGRDLLCHVDLGDGTGGGAATRDLRVLAPADAELREGDVVGVKLRRDRLHLFARDERGARLVV